MFDLKTCSCQCKFLNPDGSPGCNIPTPDYHYDTCSCECDLEKTGCPDKFNNPHFKKNTCACGCDTVCKNPEPDKVGCNCTCHKAEPGFCKSMNPQTPDFKQDTCECVCKHGTATENDCLLKDDKSKPNFRESDCSC